MPLLSIITPALISDYDRRAFFLETYESLLRQEGLGDWEWEWIVQEDGARPQLREVLPDEPRISYGAVGSHLGAAACRTLALERARGEYVRSLDADDVLLRRGLAAPLQLLTRHDRAVWAAGERWTLQMPDRQIIEEPLTESLAFGEVAPNQLHTLLRDTGNIVIHCGGITVRTDLLRAYGSWMALPRSEDVIPIYTMSRFFWGVYTPEPTFLYRRWPGQETQKAWWSRLEPTVRSILWQRIRAADAVTQRHADHDQKSLVE